MSKIGKKIIFSYIVIVIFTITTSLSITKINFTENLNNQILRDLQSDANVIAQQIENNLTSYQSIYSLFGEKITLEDIFPNDAVFRYSVRFASTNILVLDNERKVIYQSWKKESDFQDFSVGSFDENQYFVHETKILDKDSEIIGYLLAMAKKEDTGLINALINKAAIVGFAMSLIISIIIAFIFERNLINPINRLKHNISKFKISGENQWEAINTKDEIADLNTDFKNMAQNLVKYDRQQKDFFQNSSHELKTPLMSIHGYAEAIKDGVVPPEEIISSLDIIIEETNKLADIVNDIMYLTRLDDKTDFKEKHIEISLKEFIDEILPKFDIILSERNIVVKNNVESDIKVRMEEEHLFRIFTNLISNSLRYASSEIIIESETKNGLIIRLYDDGHGFEEKEIPHVFERFFKGYNGKTGLGLAIVKSTIENYNGSVKVYNKANAGACVEIRFNK
ncbi:sensor histidine kinase [Proteocatella sphenisci]|uniref:sensor histidine kinase n=1 Tax=Proteocatella sphenisci TaxID=181070 RepID=UPI00048BBAA7|nr:HAMP domain-containing sensor histidine kinase [Proteocatella sphenisci]